MVPNKRTGNKLFINNKKLRCHDTKTTKMSSQVDGIFVSCNGNCLHNAAV